jgi:hypothetical protein
MYASVKLGFQPYSVFLSASAVDNYETKLRVEFSTLISHFSDIEFYCTFNVSMYLFIFSYLFILLIEELR